MPRSKKYRFHLDENFPVSAGKFLASLGHNVSYASTVQHGELRGRSDYHQIRFATKDHRIFLTHDRDFRQAHLLQLVRKSPGLIAVRGGVSKTMLRKLLSAISTKKLLGRICRLSFESISFR